MPLARETGMGSTLDCADHSKSVCFFDIATISSPVIAARTSVAMSPLSLPFLCLVSLRLLGLLQHAFALGAEFVAGLPFGEPVRLRHAVANREEYSQILVRARQIPVGHHDVAR